MADIISAPIIGYSLATGITIVGVATGADPVLMGAGACGGWWALSYVETPTPALVRINNVVVSAVIASYGSTVLAAELGDRGWITETAGRPWTYVLAIAIGLLTMPVLGSLVMNLGRGLGRFLQRWVDRMGGPQ